eukprot:1340517-Amorphochlora_amoeboformis.AAC.1
MEREREAMREQNKPSDTNKNKEKNTKHTQTHRHTTGLSASSQDLGAAGETRGRKGPFRVSI